MKYIFIILATFINIAAFGQTAADHAKNADAEADKENFKNALKEIERAIEIEPGSAVFQCRRADFLLNLGRVEDAFHAYTESIKLDEHYSMAYNGRAIIEEAAGVFDAAIVDFERAAENAENDTMRFAYITNVAAAQVRVRDFQGAYESLMDAYRFDSTDVAMLNNLATVCDELGQQDLALKYLFRVLKLDPEMYGANINIGFIYQNMNRHKEAIIYFDEALAHMPDDPLAYNNRAYSKLQLKDLKGAMSDVEKSIKIYPSNSYAYKNRALIYFAQGKNDKACADLQLAIEKGFTAQYGPEVEELLRKKCR